MVYATELRVTVTLWKFLKEHFRASIAFKYIMNRVENLKAEGARTTSAFKIHRDSIVTKRK